MVVVEGTTHSNHDSDDQPNSASHDPSLRIIPRTDLSALSHGPCNIDAPCAPLAELISPDDGEDEVGSGEDEVKTEGEECESEQGKGERTRATSLAATGSELSVL